MPDVAEEIVEIGGRRWRLGIWPTLGGALVAASARLGGGWLCVTPPVDAAILAQRDIRKLGGFVMAPFCNRLAGGSFTYGGAARHVPLNWPNDPASAIHGTSWQRPWKIEERSADHLQLFQRIDEPGNAFRYEATLTLDVRTAAAEMTLSVKNLADDTLPYGVGFHPYFRRTPRARLSFAADGWLEPDARCYPQAWYPISEARDAAGGRSVEAFAGVDATFTGWTGMAMLAWPEFGAALTIEASRTAAALHAYVPRGERFLCLEPVSHVVDVANRREFARFGDMTPLAPRERLAISMRWRLAPLTE